MTPSFVFATNPEFYFGIGKRHTLATLALRYGKTVLLVTGANSFSSTLYYQDLLDTFSQKGLNYHHFKVDQEPSPALIDTCTARYHSAGIDLVLSIGGGSVLDAGKAISAMLPLGGAVREYLEGVGTNVHPGTKVPMIAVPTTSGTGSEATKNAVLSEIGENGFKKSLRHQNFIPNIALIDPELLISCPKEVTAFSGMDAFTQLLESFLATTANPMTDALAKQGLELIFRSLIKAYQDGNDVEARADMALASYWSGITLANSGLGLVHGVAGALGGYFKIPHGVICSRLMYAANVFTVQKLRASMDGGLALTKYALVGKMCAKQSHKTETYYIDYLLDYIRDLTLTLNIPQLSSCGLTAMDIPRIIAASDCKNNPVQFSKVEMIETLQMAL